MGFENVDKKVSFKKLSELAVGDSVTGYLTSIQDSTKIEGAKNLVMRISGEPVIVGASGNLKYLIKDNKLTLNVNTRITREPDIKIKGKTSFRFKVEQDMSDVVMGTAPAQLEPSPAASKGIAEKLKSFRG